MKTKVFFYQKPILLYLIIQTFCQFIIIVLNRSMALKVEDIFFVSIKNYYYNSN